MSSGFRPGAGAGGKAVGVCARLKGVKKICVFLLVLLWGWGGLEGLSAVEWPSVDLDFSFSWRHNAQIGGEPRGKQPDIIQFTVGAAVFGDLDGRSGGFYFRPGGWLSWTAEEVYEGIARPTDEATLAHMRVLGLTADAPFGYAFSLGKADIGVHLGPALFFRFPLWTAQKGTADPPAFWRAYYAKVQFIYVSMSLWGAFPVSERLDFLVGLRAYQAVSNFWVGAPPLHNFQAGLMFSLRFGTGRGGGE